MKRLILIDKVEDCPFGSQFYCDISDKIIYCGSGWTTKDFPENCPLEKADIIVKRVKK